MSTTELANILTSTIIKIVTSSEYLGLKTAIFEDYAKIHADLKTACEIIVAANNGLPIFHETIERGFVNNANGWGFSKPEIEEASKTGQLLTLDIDFGNTCSLHCPHCFRRGMLVDYGGGQEMNFDDAKELILQAKQLGLKSVKFLGKGDPLESSELFNFLEFLHHNNIIPLIFTKGHVIACDEEIKRLHRFENGKRLVKRLKELNVTLLFGFNSLNKDKQNRLVGYSCNAPVSTYGSDYFTLRNSALKILIEEGYNEFNPGRATQLAFCMNPITKDNIDEAIFVYILSRLCNIYPVITPTMMSGAGAKSWKENYPPMDKLLDLYVNIYSFNTMRSPWKIQRIYENSFEDSFQKNLEMMSPYAGGHVCNQTAAGLYVSLNGKVLSCPGNDKEDFCEGQVDFQSLRRNPTHLEEIWKKSNNYRKRRGIYNCYCIAKDGESIPHGFYMAVLEHVNQKKYSQLRCYLKSVGDKIMWEFARQSGSQGETKYVGVSIQLKNDSQGDFSLTRKCGGSSLIVGRGNKFCEDVLIKNRELCDTFDFCLKAKLKEERMMRGYACKCHKGISNIVLKEELKILETAIMPEETVFYVYVFIGQFLFRNTSGESFSTFLQNQQIKELQSDGISNVESHILKPRFAQDNLDMREIFTEENYEITCLNCQDIEKLLEIVRAEIAKLANTLRNSDRSNDSESCAGIGLSLTDRDYLKKEVNECEPTLPKSPLTVKIINNKIDSFIKYCKNLERVEGVMDAKANENLKVLKILMEEIKKSLSLKHIEKWREFYDVVQDGFDGKTNDEKWMAKIIDVGSALLK